MVVSHTAVLPTLSVLVTIITHHPYVKHLVAFFLLDLTDTRAGQQVKGARLAMHILTRGHCHPHHICCCRMLHIVHLL